MLIGIDEKAYEGFGGAAVIFGSLRYQRATSIKLYHCIVGQGRSRTARGNEGKDNLGDDEIRPSPPCVSRADTYRSRERIRPYSPEARDYNMLHTKLCLDAL